MPEMHENLEGLNLRFFRAYDVKCEVEIVLSVDSLIKNITQVTETFVEKNYSPKKSTELFWSSKSCGLTLSVETNFLAWSG